MKRKKKIKEPPKNPIAAEPRKNFFFLALPSIYWWIFILYCIIFGLALQYEGIAGDYIEPGMELLEGMKGAQDIAIAIVLCTIFAAIVLPILVIYYAIFFIIITFATPIELLCGNGFYISNWLMWLMLGAIILTVFGAIKFKMGEFMADSSYVSGYHWEITSVGDDTVTATKVEERSGGGEWILNVLLFIARMLIIAGAGWIIWIYKTVKKRKAKREE